MMDIFLNMYQLVLGYCFEFPSDFPLNHSPPPPPPPPPDNDTRWAGDMNLAISVEHLKISNAAGRVSPLRRLPPAE